MARLEDSIPEPRRSWPDVDGPTPQTATSLVTRRRDSEKDGEMLTWIEVDADDGTQFEISLNRSDLHGLRDGTASEAPIAEGDTVAIRFWGKQGQRLVLTHSPIQRSGAQGTLGALAHPAGDAPPLTDEDFVPDDEGGA